MNRIRLFGAAPSGEAVYLIELNNGTLCCEIITLGASIRALKVPDRDGKSVDVVLGFDTAKEYARYGFGYMGATVGRFANRIAGAKFQLNGQSCQLTANMRGHHLHGGRQGFSHRVWQITEVAENAVTLTLFSHDGEEGYPGNLICSVQFRLDGSTLAVQYRAKADRDTVCSLTNHSYFNLAGQGSVFDQNIQLFASHYIPTNPEGVPYGTMEPVENTPMDLRKPTPIGIHLPNEFHQLKKSQGYDHNYVIDGEIGTLRPAARAYAPASGIALSVATTLPGIQFYTGNYLPGKFRGKGGAVYGTHHAFCLETQFFPDSPNQPNFPSAVLKAGEEYDHTTLFSFSCPGSITR